MPKSSHYGCLVSADIQLLLPQSRNNLIGSDIISISALSSFLTIGCVCSGSHLPVWNCIFVCLNCVQSPLYNMVCRSLMVWMLRMNGERLQVLFQESGPDTCHNASYKHTPHSRQCISNHENNGCRK